MDITNHFLIPTGNVDGSIFSDSIVYVCRHDEDGAFGIIVNKPSHTSVENLLDSLKVETPQNFENMVLQGGPVKPEQVFILHSPPTGFDVTIKVGNDVGITLSRDILTAISENRAPKKIAFAFGYTGWEKGQLEREIHENSWIPVPASADIIFDIPAATRLSVVARRVGFDINNLSDVSGHA